MQSSYTRQILGASPRYTGLAQLARATLLHREGWGFKSLIQYKMHYASKQVSTCSLYRSIVGHLAFNQITLEHYQLEGPAPLLSQW